MTQKTKKTESDFNKRNKEYLKSVSKKSTSENETNWSKFQRLFRAKVKEVSKFKHQSRIEKTSFISEYLNEKDKIVASLIVSNYKEKNAKKKFDISKPILTIIKSYDNDNNG